jgi:hypothetical protein
MTSRLFVDRRQRAGENEMRQRLTSNAGFTFIEVTFAGGILLFTLGIVFSVILSTALVGEVAEQRDISTSAAASVMDTLRGQAPDRLLNFDPASPEPAKNVSVTVEAADNAGQWRRLPLPSSERETFSAPQGFVKIRVTATAATLRGHPVRTTLSSFFIIAEASHGA